MRQVIDYEGELQAAKLNKNPLMCSPSSMLTKGMLNRKHEQKIQMQLETQLLEETSLLNKEQQQQSIIA